MSERNREAREDAETTHAPPKLARVQLFVLALFFVLPLLLIAVKASGAPAAAFLMQYFSFAEIPLQHAMRHVLLVPLGAILVVLFRLTLGVQVLGPFRPILIAFAFQLTGILPGLLFLLLIVAMILSIRPLIRALRLPYFGRVSVMLSAVTVLLAVAILAARSLHLEVWQGIAHFPVVVLCLVSEAFARTIKSEGVGSGLWRGGMTIIIAVLLAWLAEIPLLSRLLLSYPELLVMQIAIIVLISKYCAWHIFDGLNPGLGQRLDRSGAEQPGHLHPTRELQSRLALVGAWDGPSHPRASQETAPSVATATGKTSFKDR
jgi:hypothetical protein